MDLTPGRRSSRCLPGAAIAYGLTEGIEAVEISLTGLGRQIVSPLEEGADLDGKVEAFLPPRVIKEFCPRNRREFLFPREDIAINVLAEMGVAKERGKEVLGHIVDGATELGLISEIKGKKFVNLSRRQARMNGAVDTHLVDEATSKTHVDLPEAPDDLSTKVQDDRAPAIEFAASKDRLRKVFITHGKNQSFMSPSKSFSRWRDGASRKRREAVSSKPVPKRSCRI